MQKIWLIILSTLVFSIAAEESKTDQTSDKAIEFYAGISLGWDHLVAKRNEELVAGVTNTNLIFSNRSQTANGLNGKIILGLLWNIPNTNFVLSPEIYIGQGNAQITRTESMHDPIGNTDKTLQSSLKQGLSMGVILRTGFYLTNSQNNLVYLLIGIDQTKFENRFTLSSTPFFAGYIPPVSEKRSKFLRSPVIGIGFERKFCRFKVGVDLRYLNYSAWDKYSIQCPVSNDRLYIKFKPRIFSTALNICYLF